MDGNFHLGDFRAVVGMVGPLIPILIAAPLILVTDMDIKVPQRSDIVGQMLMHIDQARVDCRSRMVHGDSFC